MLFRNEINVAPKVRLECSVGFHYPPKVRVVKYRGFFGLGCFPDAIEEGIAAGQTWNATSRGVCLVTSIKQQGYFGMCFL